MEKAGEQLGQDLGCVSTEVRGGGVEAGSSKVLKQTFAAALPRSRALAGYSTGSPAHPQESAISRLPSGSISWLFTCDQRHIVHRIEVACWSSVALLGFLATCLFGKFNLCRDPAGASIALA